MLINIHKIFLAVWFSVAVSMAAAAPMEIIHSDTKLEPKNIYKSELYKLLLESTRAEFGDYTIHANPIKSLSTERLAMLLSQGEQINMLWASPGTPIANADVIQISGDILNGLMGYRICITSEKGQAELNAINNLTTLQKNVIIGQGAGWADVNIYEANKIRVTTSPSFEGLFAMVAANRFNCLAFGADEVGPLFNARKPTFPNLTIEKNLIIYYEYPIYLYVSAAHPEIAKRFKRGFEIIRANGEFNKLFKRYYDQEVKWLNMNQRKIVCVKSPYRPAADQCKNLEKLMLIQ